MPLTSMDALRGVIEGCRRPLCVRGRRILGGVRGTDGSGAGHGRGWDEPRTRLEQATDGAGKIHGRGAGGTGFIDRSHPNSCPDLPFQEACSVSPSHRAPADKPGYRVLKAGVRAGWLSIADTPGRVLDFEPTGSAAAFVPVEFPDLVFHGEGRFEAAKRELVGPCDQLLAVCSVLVSATANAGGLAEDLQYTGGRGFGCRRAVWRPAMGMLRIMSAAQPRSSCWRQRPASAAAL